MCYVYTPQVKNINWRARPTTKSETYRNSIDNKIGIIGSVKEIEDANNTSFGEYWRNATLVVQRVFTSRHNHNKPTIFRIQHNYIMFLKKIRCLKLIGLYCSMLHYCIFFIVERETRFFCVFPFVSIFN